ncbi:NADP-dependent 3-hydroxy acid dehydrogenase YdfG [Pseudonocardia sediminis]|uniref:NADP-dependent 3-hydroxy acid dehydrogenase YdfG n=1 Tax=Pseudonocardia sediminis TaxID=1397368 RepID=A0A4Q7UWC8_PSEST|nr:SDR family oxidoreductase [Pseudonocardia sediminis]RZT85288.1 NADP-dependent 3-hydroxy acid dehydrogenase YdfG [Pseudonocardia sediminis]
MTGRLDGTTAVVTGASSGIGAATARALAAEGATVALLARRRDRLEELAAELGERTSVHETDVADEAAVRASLEAVVAAHGGIDVLVNNAGYGKIEPVADAEWSNWRTMVDVNVLGVFAAAMAAVPHLVKAADGPRGVADMITVSSVAGRKVVKGTNVYAATKHAVGAFSEGLRQELAEQHVRVGLVEPGLVRTELTQDPTSGTAEIRDNGYAVMEASDIADAIVYAVTRPARVAVNEILIRPTEQTR